MGTHWPVKRRYRRSGFSHAPGKGLFRTQHFTTAGQSLTKIPWPFKPHKTLSNHSRKSTFMFTGIATTIGFLSWYAGLKIH
jgi:hypothetical protein